MHRVSLGIVIISILCGLQLWRDLQPPPQQWRMLLSQGERNRRLGPLIRRSDLVGLLGFPSDEMRGGKVFTEWRLGVFIRKRLIVGYNTLDAPRGPNPLVLTIGYRSKVFIPFPYSGHYKEEVTTVTIPEIPPTD
jgi:hypothetical protein